MPSFKPSASLLLPCLVLLIFWARPTHAFGAGNIASTAKIEGQNWRHGDIEDTLLTLLVSSRTGKKFSKMDVKRVYFGNWLRDYSQAVDVGTVKFVSSEAIRILLWVLGFMSFGYGTKEFEVTRDRLGCYRPEEHIDNPKDYADNEDARQYDRRLRAPVDENRELAIDPRTGLKNYIASEDLGITTSAGMVRDLFRRCIDLGRRSGGRGEEFYEALRLLGTACHCLEDYSAHSNYTELALIELGERNVFPHVGRNAQFRIEGARNPVYPIVTGTFGGVDFLHSVMGEISDKATQSEIQELEGAISNSQNKESSSMIKDLLKQLPEGLFGGKDQGEKADELESNSQAAQMGNLEITPKEPEAFTQQMDELVKQIYPIMEWHDEVMQSIAAFIENIPILPDLIENVQEQVSVFVFSLLAPYVLPIITQIKKELETGSSEVIASSREKQHIVFHDDNSTDPTHSMLSKDHFTNVLNEPAGTIASAVLTWVVPQIVECWDDENIDEERVIQRIVTGVFHHPALKDYGEDGAREGRRAMFGVVEQWWGRLSERARDDLRGKLTREGVQSGRNHKEGVHDKGHGCGKPLSMANDFSGLLGGGGKSSKGKKDPYAKASKEAGKLASEAVGGGALGGLVGGLVGGVGASLLGGAFGEEEKSRKKKEKKYDDGSYSTGYEETGHHKSSGYGDEDRYGKAKYEETQYSGGGRREEYSRYEEDSKGSYGYKQKVETSSYGGSGGYERREERTYQSGDRYQTEEKREGFDSSGQYYKKEKKHHGKYSGGEEEEGEESGTEEEKRRKKEKKRREKEEKKKYKSKYDDDDEDEKKKYKKYGDDEEDSEEEKKKKKKKDKDHKRRSGDYGGDQSYGGGQSYGGNQGYGEERRYGETERSTGGYGGSVPGGYPGGQQEYGGGGGYGGRESYGGSGRQEYGGRQEESYGGSGRQEYGGRQQEYGGGYGGRQEESYGSQQQYGGGGYGGAPQQEYGGGYGGRQQGYGEERQEYGGGHGHGHHGRRDDDEYGGRQQGYGGGGYGGSGGYSGGY